MPVLARPGCVGAEDGWLVLWRTVGLAAHASDDCPRSHSLIVYSLSLWQRRTNSRVKPEGALKPAQGDIALMWHGCAGDMLLHEAVNMSSRVGLVKPNDHIVVVQMISDSLVVKASPSCSVPLLCSVCP